MFKLSDNSKVRLSGVDERLIEVVELALSISKVDFGIPKFGGLRTEEDQYQLYSEGSSKCDGYKKKSYHQTGKAFDVYAYVCGRASWDELHLSQVATAILSAASQLGVPIKWGGHFKNFNDMPHFELAEY